MAWRQGSGNDAVLRQRNLLGLRRPAEEQGGDVEVTEQMFIMSDAASGPEKWPGFLPGRRKRIREVQKMVEEGKRVRKLHDR